MEPMYRVDEIMKQASVGRRKVMSWIKSGRLEAVDLRGDDDGSYAAIRVRKSEWERFVRDRVVPTAAPRRKKRHGVTHHNLEDWGIKTSERAR